MSDADEPNEILAETRAMKRHKDAVADSPEPATGLTWPIAAAGVAIGSAALAAALLYAKARKK
ncbi:MAG: hypothetical protein M3R41_08195 [Pseudomonadota bacterium]|nr:hypothetical protein [Pseudomonadota bacterium]